jgi:hypothetical protein
MSLSDPRWKTLLARSISEHIGNDKSTRASCRFCLSSHY